MTADQLCKIKIVCKLLREYFDVGVEAPKELASVDLYYQVKSDEPLLFFASEGAGGFFFQGKSSGNILYVSSEGAAGVVARSLEELLTLVVRYPYWQDLLKFSNGGDIELMRLVAELSEPDLQDDEPEIDKTRKKLAQALSLDLSVDPIENLHRSLTTESRLKSVLAPDGLLYDSLFGKFKPTDNPAWR